MAEDVEMIPVDAAEPPKAADPLNKPAGATATLKPVPPVTRPVVGGATQSGLKPGLRLPPKPGATQNGLKPGLRLPPKPGATQTALKPGIKLPPKPGATQTALKPGIKLPPKPVIRKPGSAVSPAGLPKPVLPKPIAPAAAAPAAPAAAPAPAAPAVTPVDAQGIGKLPTVEAAAVKRGDTTPVVSNVPKPMEALKSVTQKLKGITQQIPQQAILRKTGIIADGAMSEGQKEAAKHKTARISLSDAMGVAPVKHESAPMKTIRIKRPTDIGASPTQNAPRPSVAAPAAAAEAPTAPAAAAPAAAEAPAEATATVTQRKTLKISRPGAVRPTGKFGIKRPGAAPAAADSAAAGSENAAETAAAPAEAPVGDIPDIASIPPMPEVPAARGSDGPAWLWGLSIVVQLAACAAIGALAWFLYQNTQITYF